VNVRPRGSNAEGIIADVANWLKANRSTFSGDDVLRECASHNHPDGRVVLQVRVDKLDGSDGFVIVQRYGQMKVAESVRRALERKLPKLAATSADRRLLMLERDQVWVEPKGIHEEVERLRPSFPDLSDVHEVWIADSASMTGVREWFEFKRFGPGKKRESFAFCQGKLHSMSKNSMPIPRSRWCRSPKVSAPHSKDRQSGT
jgi:hypothetical protein